jgi:hypothetical protein
VETRLAGPDDLDGLTNTLALAFEHDPLWRWAFPEPGTLEPLWRFFIRSALRRYPSVSVSHDCAAAAVWIPPGGSELTEALLADNLARLDEEGAHAYLESSNPANDARYERVGFERVGECSTPDGAHTVATMWREARA